jgi:hypothetical protein
MLMVLHTLGSFLIFFVVSFFGGSKDAIYILMGPILVPRFYARLG